MEITEVKVFPVDEEKLKAFVSIVFDRSFMVNDIKIIQGRDGLFISMPSRKKKNGEFKDVAHPLNNETRQMIELRVVEEYERVLGERGEELPAPARAYPGSDATQSDDGAGDGEPERRERPQARQPAPETEEEPESGQQPAPPPESEAPPMAAAGNDEVPAAIEEPANEASSDEDDGKEDKGKSLEEVQERHLRDSFWSVS
jgi:stage V sporulation protein G